MRVVGLSELVRGHEVVFLTELDKLAELRPEDTQLVDDDSPQYRRSRLYLESLVRRTTEKKIEGDWLVYQIETVKTLA